MFDSMPSSIKGLLQLDDNCGLRFFGMLTPFPWRSIRTCARRGLSSGCPKVAQIGLYAVGPDIGAWARARLRSETPDLRPAH